MRDNLEMHEPGFPTAERLLSVISEGRPAFGMSAVGEGKDSAGSEALIAAVDRDDPRPVWVPVWGGPNVLAQALWKVRATRSPEALAKFVAKLRVYTISDQDDSGPWIRKTFPDLFYIASPGVHAGGAYHFATWSGISGDNFHGRFAGADFTLVDNPWLDQNIRRKGPLGAQYPRAEFLMEGDTPSFLGLVNNGLSVPEHPDWGGWGGRYELYTPRTQKWFQEPETRPFWTDAEDEVRGVDGALAHDQPRDDLALALRLSERLRRPHGLDDQAVRRGQPSAGAEARHPDELTARARRARATERGGLDRPRRRRALVRVVLLRRAGHLHDIQRPQRPAGHDSELRSAEGLVHGAHGSRHAARHGHDARHPRRHRPRHPAADPL